MKTVTKENIYETVINKSRFISYLAPIQSTEEAKTYHPKSPLPGCHPPRQCLYYRSGWRKRSL